MQSKLDSESYITEWTFSDCRELPGDVQHQLDELKLDTPINPGNKTVLVRYGEAVSVSCVERFEHNVGDQNMYCRGGGEFYFRHLPTCKHG